jgi:hypothetical protein
MAVVTRATEMHWEKGRGAVYMSDHIRFGFPVPVSHHHYSRRMSMVQNIRKLCARVAIRCSLERTMISICHHSVREVITTFGKAHLLSDFLSA